MPETPEPPATPSAAQPAVPAAEELLPSTRRALLHRLARAQSEGRTPSMVGAVVRDGATVWTSGRSMVEGHGPDGDTQYRIGSLTKSFVAVLVMRLRDEGLLDLVDPLELHLPGAAPGGATIAQLLAHTSGLAAETPGPWWERTSGELRPELADVLGAAPLKHPVGRVHHYSNPGFALLGALVERLRGKPWGEVLRAEVLEPLGMARTTLLPRAPHAGGWAVHPWADVMQPEPLHDTGRMAPAGQLWSTADDLCRWAVFLSAGDERVLSAASVAEMRTPAAAPAGADWDPGYGLGLQLLRRDGRLLAGHTGSMPGFLAALWVSVEDGVGALVLTNATSGPQVTAAAADLVAIVADNEPRFPVPWRPRSSAEPALLALTGPWYWGTNPFVLRLGAERDVELAALDERGRGARFRAEPDGTWTGLDGYYAGETLRVVRGDDGEVRHLDLGSFVFTREPYDAAADVPGGVDPDGWR
ncbi:serine hydrolase domain-containing protein [Streptomyces sp. SPB162]|uniref:serine hydrolase domain-containing protein n=1 Tax=Streptomyces sp. SPB162 TaxID=2940560 RepID=UPI0024063565|nr:serine hydrolase domain-containing protein [Streptomyces sp. SPB162]MDF9814347.1 CubicO group peptidase (beta-lactamase class C family) [Streptomyces sp. SPB162]